MDRSPVTTRAVERHGAAARDGGEDAVVVEEPLELRIDGDTLAVTMRTPGDDASLAAGFLFGEGLIDALDDLGSISICGRPGDEGYGNVIDLRSGPGHVIAPERVLDSRRFLTTTSSCGVCGRRSVDDLLARVGPVGPGAIVPGAAIPAALDALASAQRAFRSTGGLHAAAALDERGALLAAAEDVGRHNAVDKVVGRLLRDGAIGQAAILAVSGRSSFEIVQKAAAAKIPIVAAVSAPSSLAIDLARSAGIALCGFVRGDAYNVYTHGWRVRGGRFGIDDPDPCLLKYSTRRALDLAGIKLSREGFSALAPGDRDALAREGAARAPDLARVRALAAAGAPIDPAPDPAHPPPGLDAPWAELHPLVRSALHKLAAKDRREAIAALLAEVTSDQGAISSRREE